MYFTIPEQRSIGQGEVETHGRDGYVFITVNDERVAFFRGRELVICKELTECLHMSLEIDPEVDYKEVTRGI